MYRNYYYPFSPSHTPLTNPYPMRQCLYCYQQMWHNQLPNPYYVNGMNQQQVIPNSHTSFQNQSQSMTNINENINEESNLPANIEEADNSGAFSYQFLNEHGQVDVNKMLSTVGQLAQTVQQVSPVIKQVNDIVQSFRV